MYIIKPAIDGVKRGSEKDKGDLALMAERPMTRAARRKEKHVLGWEQNETAGGTK